MVMLSEESAAFSLLPCLHIMCLFFLFCSASAKVRIYCRYTNIYIGQPCLEEEYRQEEITPQQCRLRDITYAAPIYVDIEYTRGKEIVTRKGPAQAVRIGRMPLMLRCNKCVLHKKDEAHLARLGECPLDPGGYFIVKVCGWVAGGSMAGKGEMLLCALAML